MSILDESLQRRYDELEREKVGLDPNNEGDVWRLKTIEQEQLAIKEQDKGQEKAAKQEVLLQLPQDYDAVTGLTGMNAEIQNLLKQVMDQLTQDHTAEIQALMEEQLQKDQVQDSVVQALTGEVESLQKADELNNELIDELQKNLNQSDLNRKDAEQKRDAAVKQADEDRSAKEKLARDNASLKEQINELEGLLRTYKKPVTTTGPKLTLTSTLQPETDEERNARLERQRLDTINRNLGRFGVEPLSEAKPPSFEEEQEVTQEELDESFPGASADASVGGEADAGDDTMAQDSEPMDQAGNETPGASVEQRLDRLNRRVTFIENQLKIATPEQLNELVASVTSHRE